MGCWLLTWKDEEELCGEHKYKECDEEKLCFVILFDWLEWNTSHETFKVNRFLEHASKLFPNCWLPCIFDHLDSSLASRSHCVAT